MNMSWNKGKSTGTKTFEERKKERLEKIKYKAKVAESYMCLGIWGEPKSAKSAISLDILSEEDQNIEFPVCNGSGDYATGDAFSFADLNGNLNGGDYKITIISMNATW